MIFQDPYSSLNPRHTVGTLVGAPFRLQNIKTEKGIKATVQELLEVVGLSPEHYNRYPHEFSGGQRQRIGIARSLALKPKLIVADEPVSALDVSIQAQVINLLEDLQDELGLTYVVIAHDLSVVRHMSDRVAVMYLGKLVEIADCDELYSRPMHPYTTALLSAVPVPDTERRTKRERIRLEGDVPSPVNPPPACRFHTRCWKAQEICKTQEPPLVQLAPGHAVACHFPENVDTVAGDPAARATAAARRRLRLPRRLTRRVPAHRRPRTTSVPTHPLEGRTRLRMPEGGCDLPLSLPGTGHGSDHGSDRGRHRGHERCHRAEPQHLVEPARDRRRALDLYATRAQRRRQRQPAQPHGIQRRDVTADGHVDREARVGHADGRHVVLDEDPEAARVVGEPEVQDVPVSGQGRGVEAAVHPPDEQLRVELVGLGVTEHPPGAPLRHAEDEGLEGTSRRREHVPRARPLDDAEALEVAQSLGQQGPREPGQSAREVVEAGGARQHVPQDEQAPPLPHDVERA